MTRFYPCDRVLARSSLALCCSIPLSWGCGDVKAAWSGELSRPSDLPPANAVKQRNLLLGKPAAPLRYGSSTTTLESIEILNRQDRWYGGFGIGITAPNLSSDGQIRGLEIPFRLDVNTNQQNSLNAFVGRRFSNFRVEAEVLSTNNSLKDADLTFVSAPGLNNRVSSGNVSNFSVMFNGYYDIDIGSAVKPFIGAGVGYSFTNSSIRSVPFPLEGTTSGLAVQFKVGAAYTLFDRTDMYVQYRYLNTPVSTQVNGSLNGNNITGNISGNLNSSIFEVGTRFNF
jgi:opacity protein-like surface antigen